MHDKSMIVVAGCGHYCSLCGSKGHLGHNPLAGIGSAVYICITCVARRVKVTYRGDKWHLPLSEQYQLVDEESSQ